MSTIRLDSIRCRSTEDIFGSDDIELEVFLDSVKQPRAFKTSMNGDSGRNVANIGRTYSFEYEVVLRLWEVDDGRGNFFDSDDLLGVVRIERGSRFTKVRFKKDGAEYEVSLSVDTTPVQDWSSGLSTEVLKRLNEFKNSPRSERESPWFPSVKKAALLHDIARTLKDPVRQIDQGSTPLCGPTSVVFELARRNPELYVVFIRELYEFGRLTLPSETKRPSRATMRAERPVNISPADWVFTAGLRDSENTVWDLADVVNDSSDAAGITMPDQMQEWTQDILGLRSSWESTYVGGEISALREALEVVKNGGVAFLFVNSSIMRSEASSLIVPDHWITLTGGTVSDRVQIECYSWGRIESINMSRSSFSKVMWGALTGMQLTSDRTTPNGSTDPRKRVVVLRESKSGRNLLFLDQVTRKTMTVTEFCQAIRRREYPGYHIRRMGRHTFPATNPDRGKGNNLG